MSKDDIYHHNLPSWLVGIWKCSYIRRACPINNNEDQSICSERLGKKDSTVTVCYIQTPSGCFVDIRRPAVLVEGAREGPMAFAAFTSVENGKEKNKSDGDYRLRSQLEPPLVNWHACIEMDNDEIETPLFPCLASLYASAAWLSARSFLFVLCCSRLESFVPVPIVPLSSSLASETRISPPPISPGYEIAMPSNLYIPSPFYASPIACPSCV
eukprot:CAMPEP_0194125494 /NCGR_PEP_ID=MMETSP0150-20130528/59493_1 /TAXON_ID=122233 /ORGANISM="Chaetoceros debilis, Strain MM31A-1" /LENGTH=212 /DNA_ID=CAMNT_0038819305 /DNA_START=765 /DNA_END=1403 /DNA_ORIENTATION=-